ncbi:hypothetical protein BH09BAC3_BH09BAC3_35330 [soil metagenome]
MEKLREVTIDRLVQLRSRPKQIAFAYSSCLRNLPNYQYFSREFGWGNEYCMLQAIDLIRHFLMTGRIDDGKNTLLKLIDENSPNSDNFQTEFSTYAQNFASSLYYTLSNIENVNIDELSWVLVLSRDTVDAFIHSTDEYDGDDEGHWMIKRELEKQEFDFNILSAYGEIDIEVLTILSNYNSGKSTIDIPR